MMPLGGSAKPRDYIFSHTEIMTSSRLREGGVNSE